MDEGYEFLSELEKKVYDWLTKNKIPFETQETMFGPKFELGSATVDFILPLQNIALRVMGSYYHSSQESRARDELGKERLVNAGYIVIDIWEESLSDDNLEHTMRLAIRGEEAL